MAATLALVAAVGSAAAQSQATVSSRTASAKSVRNLTNEAAPSDAVVEPRVAAFLTSLADSLSAFADCVREPGPRGVTGSLFYLAWTYSDHGEEGARGRRHADERQSPLMRLDSARALWTSSTPVVKGRWLYGEDGLQFIGKSLIPLVLKGKMRRPAEMLAQSMTRLSERIERGGVLGQDKPAGPVEWGAVARGIAAEARLLETAAVLQRGDTATARPMLLALARVGTTSAAHRAADMLVEIAGTDPEAMLTATTLAYLMNAGTDSVRKNRDYTRLRTLYANYVRAHGTAPDVVPNVMTDVPPPVTPPSLDGYLDRQFGVLYDRAFLVPRAEMSAAGEGTRVVIAEYTTGVFCSSCWVEDRAFNAILRRYPAERVIPLGYHNYYPITRSADNVWTRWSAWYPLPYIFANQPPAPSVVSWRSNIAANGDTLNDIRVNGVGIPSYRPKRGESTPEALYRVAAMSIDSMLRRAPNAVVRLSVGREGDVVTMRATVDSVAGQRSRLAFRAVLVQDTVTLRGSTNRRIYTNVVRAILHENDYPLGVPLTVPAGGTTVTHRFDVDSLNRDLQAERDPVARAKEMYGDKYSPEAVKEQAEDIAAQVALFPDDRDWRVEIDRLFVVAFVQDLDTGEILQAAMARVPPR